MSLEFLSKKKSIGGCGEPWQPQHFCALCSLPLLRFPGSVCFATQLCLEPMFQKCYGLKVCKMLGKNNKRLWPWAFLGTKKMRAFTPSTEAPSSKSRHGWLGDPPLRNRHINICYTHNPQEDTKRWNHLDFTKMWLFYFWGGYYCSIYIHTHMPYR